MIAIKIEAVSRLNWSIELGAQLKARRLAAQLSRAKVAKAAADAIEQPRPGTFGKVRAKSFSTKYLEELEQGKPDSIHIESLKALAKALNCEIPELLMDSDAIKIIF